MERELPTINIMGTDFVVDVIKEELREKGDPLNIMSMKGIADNGPARGYYFTYDVSTKNFPEVEKLMQQAESDELVNIELPEFKNIDPIGMAEKYKISLEQVHESNSDFELAVVPGSPLDRRLNKGILPTLEIEGHIFYVDVQMNKLRPKDDFKSKGIDFREIADYYDRYSRLFAIPYNPVTHEFQEIDLSVLRDLPKDTIVIQFPHPHVLDPIGWGKKYGDEYNYLSFEGMQFQAHTLPWSQTNLIENIKRNVGEQLMPKEEYADQYIMSKDNLYRIPTETKGMLPTYDIMGTPFIVDVNQLELREKSNPLNVISIADMWEDPQEGYHFWYDPNNHHVAKFDDPGVKLVKIPDFVKLDPKGMAEKHHISDVKIKRMRDFDLMVDQDTFDKIDRKEQFPTIDIKGQIFDVDVFNSKLHPRDDIWSRGILFSELKYYYSRKDENYIIPYNQKTQTFQEVNLNLKEIPEDLIVVKIPNERSLDPISQNKKDNIDTSSYLKKGGVSLRHKAMIIPWEHTLFADTIKQNKIQERKIEQNIKKKKGPRI